MEAVRRYNTLDTGPGGAFDRIAAMGAWSAVSGDVQSTRSAGVVAFYAVVVLRMGVHGEQRVDGQRQGTRTSFGGEAYRGDLARRALRLMLEDAGTRILGIHSDTTFGPCLPSHCAMAGHLTL
ncbi:hypothetical protein [Streptomyces rishiriensis]|uniref:hypothetical protein n=1 Tax=Streptomyces rishiriensis TaxID=68264 RepID=UPI0037D8A92E